MIIVQMHGLPGSGKSTIARALGAELRAVVIDKDVIKAALLASGVTEAQAAPGAYEVYFNLADAMAAQGHSIILDNPVFWPRVEERWLALCGRYGVPPLMIECVCADREELARRVATRNALPSQPRTLFPPRRDDAFESTAERLVLETLRPLDELVADALAYVRTGVPA